MPYGQTSILIIKGPKFGKIHGVNFNIGESDKSETTISDIAT